VRFIRPEQKTMDAFPAGGLLALAIYLLGFILAIAWIVRPRALIGTKPLLRELIAEVRRTNALLERRGSP
jgi:hypothetical protein